MIGIAIDGPSGAGKSTVAKALAKDLGFIYVDTGAIYRTVGLYMHNIGISTEDKEGIENNLSGVDFELKYIDGEQRMFLCGEDVSNKIRTPIIAKYASVVSAVPKVREFLLETQKKLARENNVIMDGRDIGTVILPDAEVKIFLTASAESRADRRVKQLAEKGEIVSHEEILAAIKERDDRDSGRDVAPLKPADDAVTLDTSDMTLEESIAAAKKIALDKLENSKKKEYKPSKFYDFIVKVFEPIVRFVMRIKTYGSENEQIDGPLIVCANHIAMFDVISLVASFKRQLRMLAKKEVFKVPVLAQFARAMGAYSVDRGRGDVAAIKKTLSILEEGGAVAMFPQGTRCPYVDPARTEVKSGVGMMLYRSKANVQPVYIRVKNNRYRFLRKKEVIIGEVIRYEEFGFVNGGKEEYERAAKLVFDRILALRYEGTNK